MKPNSNNPSAEPSVSSHGLLSHLRVSIVATLALAVIVCGIYPLIVFGLAQLIFPHQANGSLIGKDGKPVSKDTDAIGSALLGQNFSDRKYFHPRPSAAGNGYDPTASGGSNLGPTSAKLIDTIRLRITHYRQENRLPDEIEIPADAVTASASGLDPHISVANAMLQAQRVADSRKLAPGEVKQLIEQYTEGPDLGFLGEPRVNVLLLNLALDRVQSGSPRNKQ